MADRSFTYDDVRPDPEKFYSDPADISKDTRWSDQEKRDLLLAWEENEKALMRADSEGLEGGERPQLRLVALELEKLDAA